MRPPSLLLREGCALPHGVNLVLQPVCPGWVSVVDKTLNALDLEIRSAGWHFIWLADEHIHRGMGRTSERAQASALQRVLAYVPSRFNAAEMDLVRVGKYLGFHVARVRLHARQIQEHVSLGGVDEMILRPDSPTGNSVSHA